MVALYFLCRLWSTRFGDQVLFRHRPQPLDRTLSPHSSPTVADRFTIDKLNRPPGPRVFSPASCIMQGYAGLHILCNAGVKTAVRTPNHIDIPSYHIKCYAVHRIKYRFQGTRRLPRRSGNHYRHSGSYGASLHYSQYPGTFMAIARITAA